MASKELEEKLRKRRQDLLERAGNAGESSGLDSDILPRPSPNISATLHQAISSSTDVVDNQQEQEEEEEEDQEQVATTNELNFSELSQASSVNAVNAVNETTTSLVVLYDFSAEHEEELSVKAGDQLFGIECRDDGWWYAEYVDSTLTSHYGLVPASYVSSEQESFLTTNDENVPPPAYVPDEKNAQVEQQSGEVYDDYTPIVLSETAAAAVVETNGGAAEEVYDDFTPLVSDIQDTTADDARPSSNSEVPDEALPSFDDLASRFKDLQSRLSVIEHIPDNAISLHDVADLPAAPSAEVHFNTPKPSEHLQQQHQQEAKPDPYPSVDVIHTPQVSNQNVLQAKQEQFGDNTPDWVQVPLATPMAMDSSRLSYHQSNESVLDMSDDVIELLYEARKLVEQGLMKPDTRDAMKKLCAEGHIDEARVILNQAKVPKTPSTMEVSRPPPPPPSVAKETLERQRAEQAKILAKEQLESQRRAMELQKQNEELQRKKVEAETEAREEARRRLSASASDANSKANVAKKKAAEYAKKAVTADNMENYPEAYKYYGLTVDSLAVIAELGTIDAKDMSRKMDSYLERMNEIETEACRDNVVPTYANLLKSLQIMQVQGYDAIKKVDEAEEKAKENLSLGEKAEAKKQYKRALALCLAHMRYCKSIGKAHEKTVEERAMKFADIAERL